MAFNTKSIIKDVNQKPVPQYFNKALDTYEVVEGENGANKVILYDKNGNEINLVTLITNIITAINTTGTTQLREGTSAIGKVEVTSNALPTGASTLEKQDQMITVLTNVIAEIAKPVKLSGSTMEYYGKSTDIKPTNNVVVGSTYFEINTSKVYMYDGSAWVVI